MSDEKLQDEKLQKVLARAGLGSRREMERAIAEGRVTVEGKPATLGDRVGSDVRIHLDGREVKLTAPDSARGRILMYNKPDNEICSRKDPEGRRSVFESLPRVRGERWISVGRLDYSTSGLLLFTTDGELANKLMHPSSVIEREYMCRVMGTATQDSLQALIDGIMLDDGVARFTDIVDGGGEGINHWYYVVIMEGRNREVRRLWESQGLQVSRLKRVRYGKVFLSPKLKAGQWMELPHEDVSKVYEMAGLTPPGKSAVIKKADSKPKGKPARSKAARGAPARGTPARGTPARGTPARGGSTRSPARSGKGRRSP